MGWKSYGGGRVVCASGSKTSVSSATPTSAIIYDAHTSIIKNIYRTGNRQAFEYAQDNEVICRFKKPLLREHVYKEVVKTKWPLTRIVEMVIRPGGFVDVTLKSKDMALSFAKALSELDSIQSATAHADTVVEVRVDFISPGFPIDPIKNYLEQNHGELLGTPIRISVRFNIQTGTRVFKLEREKLEENPILSYLYFGKYKFRVRYQGQKTTCGYCAEDDHVERDCRKKANLRVLAKTSRLQRRMAKLPTEADNHTTQRELVPTQEEAAKSFEQESKTAEERTNSKKVELPKKQEKDVNKRPLSNSSSSSVSNPPKRKTGTDEQELASLFDYTPEDNPDSRLDFTDFKLFAEDCCHELIQKCIGKHFICACEKQHYRCKCGWKLLGRETGAYRCDECGEIVANCVGCGSLQVKKKGKLFHCENCQYQLTKELHKSITF